MQYRKFGDTDLLVSEIGFGAWAIGGAAMIGKTAIGWGEADDKTSAGAIHAALDAGINFFDTADIYGLGHSEELLGKIIGSRKDIIIATKAGNVAVNDQFTVDYSAKHILDACESSLKRLKRESIDYYQLHTARMQHLQKGECIEAMKKLKQEGKIRFWGLSLNTFEPLPEANFLREQDDGDGFQLVLNLLNQKALTLLQGGGRKNYGIIARMPLQFGLLTGKFDTGFSFPDTDHRRNRITKEIVDACTAALEGVWQLCEKYHCRKASLALSFVLSYEKVAVVIPGIRTKEHVTDNTTGLFRLDEKDMQMIEELGRTSFVDVVDMIQRQG